MYSTVITKPQWDQARKYWGKDTPNFGEALFWAKYPRFYEAEMKRREESEKAKEADKEKPITGKQKRIF